MDVIFGKKKFIFDSSILIHEIDGNNIFFKTLKYKFKLSGQGIVFAFRNVINCFQEPSSKQDVIEELKNKYTKDSLSDLIDLLISKSVLISEDIYYDMIDVDSNYLEKYRFFTIGGKKLKDIVREMNSMKIGLVCTYQFLECFFSNIENQDMLGHFKCIVIDKDIINKERFVNFADISFLQDNYMAQIRELIEDSNFIIASANYECFSLFSFLNEICLKNKKQWLRIVIQDECAEIGPLFVPSETCCYSCLSKRMMYNLNDDISTVYSLLQREKSKFYEKEMSTFSSYFFSLIVCNISLYEVMRYFNGLNCPLKGSVLTFFIEGYKMKLDKVFKVRQCDSCSFLE